MAGCYRPPTGNRAWAIVAGLVGAAIIIRPGLVELNVGVLFVLGVVVVQSWNPINRRLLAQSEHPDTIAVWNPLVILPLAAIPAFLAWTTPTVVQLGWMAAIGVLEMLNQRVLGRAYSRGEAVVVVALHYTRLPIAALVGFLMFGHVPEIWIWIGGAVIAGAAIFLAGTNDERWQSYNLLGPGAGRLPDLLMQYLMVHPPV